jgi:hypothetical protein
VADDGSDPPGVESCRWARFTYPDGPSQAPSSRARSFPSHPRPRGREREPRFLGGGDLPGPGSGEELAAASVGELWRPGATRAARGYGTGGKASGGFPGWTARRSRYRPRRGPRRRGVGRVRRRTLSLASRRPEPRTAATSGDWIRRTQSGRTRYQCGTVRRTGFPADSSSARCGASSQETPGGPIDPREKTTLS